MISPKKTKFRKAFKGRIHGMAKGGTSLNFGNFGLKATSPNRVTSRQIESARRAINRHLKRSGRVIATWLCFLTRSLHPPWSSLNTSKVIVFQGHLDSWQKSFHILLTTCLWTMANRFALWQTSYYELGVQSSQSGWWSLLFPRILCSYHQWTCSCSLSL